MAGALFLLGAIVVEAISGLVVEYHGYENLLYLVVNTVEEALEIAGTLLALAAVLSAMHVERGPQGAHCLPVGAGEGVTGEALH